MTTKNREKTTVEALTDYCSKGCWPQDPNLLFDNSFKSLVTRNIANTDHHTNLSDHQLGLYAYELQEELIRLRKSKKSILEMSPFVNQTLEKRQVDIVDSETELTVTFWGEGRSVSFRNYELFIRVEEIKGLQVPIVLRNGFLAYVLKEAGITDIDQLKDYDAEVIYHPKEVNSTTVSFVRFVKKEN